MTYKKIAGLVVLGAFLGGVWAWQAPFTPKADALQQAIAAPTRTPENITRDAARKPYEVLSFLQVEPNMTVVEIWPGRGWYMEILAPYLKENGQYIGAGFNKTSHIAFYRKLAAELDEKIAAAPDVYGNIMQTELEPPQKMTIAAPNSADRVLTFRNVHNWMRNGYTDEVYQAMYKALKPNGVLGIVEHRLPEDRAQDPRALSGYVKQSVVIAQAEKAGFKLVKTSELLSNPKDTADHASGVWALPPTLRDVPEADKPKYEAIGESDRMLLMFVKPE